MIAAGVVILAGVGVGAFLAGRHSTAPSAVPTVASTSTTTTSTPARPLDAKVLAPGCGKATPAFEPTTIWFCGSQVHVVNVVWTTWGTDSAHGAGTLHEYYKTTTHPTTTTGTKTSPIGLRCTLTQNPGWITRPANVVLKNPVTRAGTTVFGTITALTTGGCGFYHQGVPNWGIGS